MTDPDRALVGAEDIAAFVEMWWRSRGRRGVRTTRRSVVRWIRDHGLPAERLAGGAWVADPAAVRSWLDAHLITSTGSARDGRRVPSAR